MMRRLACFVVLGLACGVVAAQDSKPAHVLFTPAAAKWGAPPPVFEKGASFTVISGDPSKAGLYVVRLKMPAGYKIAPHWHPTDEHVTVLSGRFALGRGEKFDRAALKGLPAGGYGLLPAVCRLFALAKRGGSFKSHGLGVLLLSA